jgi:ferredoxin-NADP reductase/MOSC domain-containing protein YiiM
VILEIVDMRTSDVLPSGELKQLRTGKTALLGSSGVLSAIRKQPQAGPQVLGLLGFIGDEQTDSFHGGAERAILQYDSTHYASWRTELAGIADLLSPGSFGENFVVDGMTEQNMCIGDIVHVGTAVLEVTESRQPCYKLDHRFGHDGMGRISQQNGRTGWFYRVLRTGLVAQGDLVEVVERPHPEWTISAVQDLLYRDTSNYAAAAEILTLSSLSASFRETFIRRTALAEVEDWEGRLGRISLDATSEEWIEVEVVAINDETSSVKSFSLRQPQGEPIPLQPGAHTTVRITNSLTRSYSLCPPVDNHHYRISVARSATSTGGSHFLHDEVIVGTTLAISRPTIGFPLNPNAQRHVLLAGGIGITPFLAMAEHLASAGADWELHYSAASAAEAPFAASLKHAYGDRVRLHASASGTRLDLPLLLANQHPGEHVYCCGSDGYMQAVRNATGHWSEGTVHFEAFSTRMPVAEPEEFTVRVASTRDVIRVPVDDTLLKTLRNSGFAIPSSCETGTCGTCRIPFLRGTPQHNDLYLTPVERENTIITCVSRAVGDLELDL